MKRMKKQKNQYFSQKCTLFLIENGGMSPHIPNNLNKTVTNSTHNVKIYNINRTSPNIGNNYNNEGRK